MLLHVCNEKQPMEGEENSNYQFREFAESLFINTALSKLLRMLSEVKQCFSPTKNTGKLGGRNPVPVEQRTAEPFSVPSQCCPLGTCTITYNSAELGRFLPLYTRRGCPALYCWAWLISHHTAARVAQDILRERERAGVLLSKGQSEGSASTSPYWVGGNKVARYPLAISKQGSFLQKQHWKHGYDSGRASSTLFLQVPEPCRSRLRENKGIRIKTCYVLALSMSGQLLFALLMLSPNY